MKKSKPRKSGISSSKNAPMMIKTTKENKIRSITKAVKVATGSHLAKLEERLKYWLSR